MGDDFKFTTGQKNKIYNEQLKPLKLRISQILLYDTKALVKKVAKKYKIKNDRIVRSDMDRALNSMLTYINKDKIYNIFGKHYDGRIISLKYFIDLCIRYLEEQRYCCLEN